MLQISQMLDFPTFSKRCLNLVKEKLTFDASLTLCGVYNGNFACLRLTSPWLWVHSATMLKLSLKPVTCGWAVTPTERSFSCLTPKTRPDRRFVSSRKSFSTLLRKVEMCLCCLFLSRDHSDVLAGHPHPEHSLGSAGGDSGVCGRRKCDQRLVCSDCLWGEVAHWQCVP